MKTPVLILFIALFTCGCTNSDPKSVRTKKIEKLQAENDSLQSIITENISSMEQQIIPFLTFQNNDAEQAMNLYVSLFDNSKIVESHRWGKDGPGKEGSIMKAVFELNGQKFMCSDTPPIHDWDFTPAISNYVKCKNEEEIERLFSKLSKNGNIAMPLDNYGFSQKFGWVIDQFGVSWQLDLP